MPKQRYKRLRSDSEGDEHVQVQKCSTRENNVHNSHYDHLNDLSLEILCRILHYLPLRDIVKLEHLSRKLQEAVTMHLRLITSVDFIEDQIYGWMPSGFSDETFSRFMKRCPEVMFIYGIHLRSLSKRRQRGSEALSVPGIITALSTSSKLLGVETCDIFLLEALLTYLPHVRILGAFKNRGGTFPIPQQNKFELTRSPNITSLYLTGVVISDLPRMEHLTHLYLKWVRLTDQNPFRDFGVPSLRTFVMSNCAGPLNALKYVPMVTALAASRSLTRLELIRVPFLGGLIQHVVEDSWRVQGFRQLHKVVFGSCKHALEVDLGFLIVTAANRLGELSIQPSLTKDSIFSSLAIAATDFPLFETLNLGFVDAFPTTNGNWSNEELVKHGLADVVESPSMITDVGLKAVGQVFSNLRNLSIYNCPHLHLPTSWFSPAGGSWTHLTELHLRRCHALKLSDFTTVIPLFVVLESLILEEMFREPPKGCSRVGLSAGTGLGVSSALVQNTGNDPANQNATNNNAAPAPAANQAAAAAANQPANDDDDDDYEDDDDDEGEDVPGNANLAQYGQANHAEAADNMADEMEVDAIENDALNDDHDQNSKPGCSCDCHKGDKATKSNKSSNTTPKPVLNKDNEPQPGTSGGMQLRPRSSAGVVTPRKEELKSKECEYDATAVDNRLNSTKSPMCKGICRRKRSFKTTETLKENKPSDYEECTPYPMENDDEQPTDKDPSQTSSEIRLRRSARLSRNNAAIEDEARRSTSPTPANSVTPCTCSSSDPDTTSPELGHRKGKSWYGRKKGIMKKQSNQSKTHQSCQAISEEIRETTKKAKEAEEAAKAKAAAEEKVNEGKKGAITRSKQRRPTTNPATTFTPIKPDASPDAGWSACGWGAHMGTRSRAAAKRKPNTKDQATSTSDPVIEDDHIQELRIRSKSLVNLSLRQVGITDLAIVSCPNLQMLSGSACRVLKNVTIKQSPRIHRVNFAQCAKLNHQMLIDEVCTNPADKNRLIVIRPIQYYDVTAVEQLLFKSAAYDYHMCLVHDHSCDPEDTVQNRTRMVSWLNTLAGINYDLSKILDFPKQDQNRDQLKKYPWGRNMYRMQGIDDFGHRWDLLSDLPWLRTLTSPNRHPMSYTSNSIPQPEDDKNGSLSGLCQEVLQEIAEHREDSKALYPHSVFVYVNLCDIDGHITEDRYV